MLKLKKVAITGGISSGKTEFCSYLQELGAYYISADNVVHQLLSPNTQLGRQVIDLLGSDIVVQDQIDRKMVAEKVFAQRGLLDKLEKIIHPAVFNEIENEYKTASQKKSVPLFIAEIPLLFETGGDRIKFFDITVAIIASKANCLVRLKNKALKDDYVLRMERQLSQEEKAAKAHIVIENDGSKEELQKKAKDLFETLTKA